MALGGRDEPRRVDPRLRRGAAIAIAVLIPVVVVAAYAVLGRPDLPDAPLATRQIDEAAPDAVEVAVTRVEAEIGQLRRITPRPGRRWRRFILGSAATTMRSTPTGQALA